MESQRSLLTELEKKPLELNVYLKEVTVYDMVIPVADIPTLDQLLPSTRICGTYYSLKVPIFSELKNQYEIVQPLLTWLPELKMKPYTHIHGYCIDPKMDKKELECVKAFIRLDCARRSMSIKDALKELLLNLQLIRWMMKQLKGKFASSIPETSINEFLQKSKVSTKTIDRRREEFGLKKKRSDKKIKKQAI